MSHFLDTCRIPLLEDLAILDERIARWIASYADGGGKIFCSRGCAGCCSLYVDVSLAEALLVQTGIEDAMKPRLTTAFERLCTLVAPLLDPLERFRAYRREVGSCPLVDNEGDCGVYRLRPAACRALLSTRTSRWCGVDFATLDYLDRKLFIDSLDASVVAMPTHYVAATQQMASFRTEEADLRMLHACGFAVRGNLVALLGLLDRGLASFLAQGEAAVSRFVDSFGLLATSVVSIRSAEEGAPERHDLSL